MGDITRDVRGESPSKSEVSNLRGQREVHEITIESIVDVEEFANSELERSEVSESLKHNEASASCEGLERETVKDASVSKGRSDRESSSSREMFPRSKSLQQIPFMSGNHCVEITKGIIHLYKENQRTPLEEEAERSELLCILAIPATMTTHDLLQFTAAVSADIEHMRIIRDSKPNQYMVLVKFRDQKSADVFYNNFNGVPFNSIEPETCHLVYVAKLETVKESEDACLPLVGHTELPTCPVCLERMDESVEGILTILCNHSFHAGCLSKWGDTSCPVCRYCQTPEPVPDNHCFGCGAQDSLWICLICGHVGCGRYVEGHAFKHYLNTQHTYAMQLGNNRVWDYAGDNYVHRLVQNKADGKPVAWEGSREDFQHEEKVDSIQLEYTYLLTSQLEAQRHFFEDQFKRMENEMHHQIEELKEKAKQFVEEKRELETQMHKLTRDKQNTDKKVNQLSQKLNKALLEQKEEEQMNICLRENQQQWQEKLAELKVRKESEVRDLQEQVHDLMFYVEAQNKLQQIPEEDRQEIQEGQIVVGSTPPAEPSGSRRRRKR